MSQDRCARGLFRSDVGLWQQQHSIAESQLALALLNVVVPDKLRLLVEHTLRVTYYDLQRNMADHRGPHVHGHVCS